MRELHLQAGINLTSTHTPLSTPGFKPLYRYSHPITILFLPCMAIMYGSHIPFLLWGHCTHKLVSMSHPLTAHYFTPRFTPPYSHTITICSPTLYSNNAGLTPPFSPVRVLHLQAGIDLTYTYTTLSHTPILAHSHLMVNICLCIVIFHFGLVEMTNCHLIFELSGYYTHKLVPMSHPYINTSHLWALVRALPCLLTIKI